MFVSFQSAVRFTLVASVAGALGGCAAPAESAPVDAEQDQEALTHAPLDTRHTFAVGVCLGNLKSDGNCSGYHCSGTLVAPNVVLTAQHCVYGIDYAEKWCDSTFSNDRIEDLPLRVTTGASSTSSGSDNKWYDVKEVLVPAKNICHDDIALVVLSKSVPSREARPVAMSLFRDLGKAPPGEVAVVGRGAIDSTVDPTTLEETFFDDGGMKRRVREHLPVVCATNSAVGCNVVDYASPPTNRFTIPPSMLGIAPAVESGDSGAGVFDQRSFGFFPTVLGVATASTVDAKGKVGTGLVVRLDIHRDFILRSMFKALLGR